MIKSVLTGLDAEIYTGYTRSYILSPFYELLLTFKQKQHEEQLYFNAVTTSCIPQICAVC